MLVTETLFEIIALTIGVIVVLTVIGSVPTLWALPKKNGLELLVCPFTGLAILYLFCQYFSKSLPSSQVVYGVTVLGSVASLAALYMRRSNIRAYLKTSRKSVAIGSSLIAVVTIILQLPMLRAAHFTLTDFSGDDIFTWVPSANYMQTHAYTAAHPTAYVSPLLWLLPTNIYSGSTGTVDGGLSALLRIHPYQFVEPFNAICLSLVVLGVYLLIRFGLEMPQWVGLVGALLAATSQSIFVVAGFGFGQSTRGSVLAIGGLVIFFVAHRNRSMKSAFICGAIIATVSAVYMPMCIILSAAVGFGILTTAFTKQLRQDRDIRNTLTMLILGGISTGVVNIWWLVKDGGIQAWISQAKVYGKGLFFVAYPFQYLLGLAPIERLYQLANVLPFSTAPTVIWNSDLSNLAVLIAIIFVAFAITGAIGLALTKQRALAAAFLGITAYCMFALLFNDGGFGSFINMLYFAPYCSALCAIGIYFCRANLPYLQRLKYRYRNRKVPYEKFASVVLALSLALILVFQIGATANTELFFVTQPGTLPISEFPLQGLAKVIPQGSTILMYSPDGVTTASTVRKTDVLTAAALFLPNRNITIEGRFFYSTYALADIPVIKQYLEANYQYVLVDQDPAIKEPAVPSTYKVVWRFKRYDLVLYERK